MAESFPNPLSKLLGGPISDVISSIGNIIDNVSTTDEERLAAKANLLKIQQDFQIRLAELDADWVKAQAEVIVAEAKSASWLARNWRPILMLAFGAIIVYNFIAAPIFGASVIPIPDDLWGLLKIGVGGYVMGRTAEKITPSIVDALSAKKS